VHVLRQLLLGSSNQYSFRDMEFIISVRMLAGSAAPLE
jgi:hypothetical protein